MFALRERMRGETLDRLSLRSLWNIKESMPNKKVDIDIKELRNGK